MSNQSRKAAALGDPLTPRESHVAEMIKNGHSTASVAKALGISWNTAKGYRKQINRKCGLFRYGKSHVA